MNKHTQGQGIMINLHLLHYGLCYKVSPVVRGCYLEYEAKDRQKAPYKRAGRLYI